jgi:hypothetical protein
MNFGDIHESVKLSIPTGRTIAVIAFPCNLIARRLCLPFFPTITSFLMKIDITYRSDWGKRAAVTAIDIAFSSNPTSSRYKLGSLNVY